MLAFLGVEVFLACTELALGEKVAFDRELAIFFVSEALVLVEEGERLAGLLRVSREHFISILL
jgi:hypothetical protein